MPHDLRTRKPVARKPVLFFFWEGLSATLLRFLLARLSLVSLCFPLPPSVLLPSLAAVHSRIAVVVMSRLPSLFSPPLLDTNNLAPLPPLPPLPLPPCLPSPISFAASCFGASDAAAAISPSGGVGSPGKAGEGPVNAKGAAPGDVAPACPRSLRPGSARAGTCASPPPLPGLPSVPYVAFGKHPGCQILFCSQQWTGGRRYRIVKCAFK